MGKQKDEDLLGGLEFRVSTLEQRTAIDPSAGPDSILKDILRQQGEGFAALHKAEDRIVKLEQAIGDWWGHTDPLNPRSMTQAVSRQGSSIERLSERVGTLAMRLSELDGLNLGEDPLDCAHESVLKKIGVLRGQVMDLRHTVEALKHVNTATQVMQDFECLEAVHKRKKDFEYYLGIAERARERGDLSLAISSVLSALSVFNGVAVTPTMTFRRYEKLAPSTEPRVAPETPDKPDPWAHRTAGMRCRTCMWFVPKGDHPAGQPAIGRCRRHAPTMSGYPAVFPDDWCGDHKLDEAKA